MSFLKLYVILVVGFEGGGGEDVGVVGELQKAGDGKAVVGKLYGGDAAMTHIEMGAEDGEGDVEKAA